MSAADTATQFVQSQGFTPRDTQDFATPPSDALHVIIASPTGSANGDAQQAFFFVDGRFLRTDLPDLSAGIDVVWRNDSTIALGYASYRPNDPPCCPKGGSLIVRYEWTGSRLRALDPIPPAAVRR